MASRACRQSTLLPCRRKHGAAHLSFHRAVATTSTIKGITAWGALLVNQSMAWAAVVGERGHQCRDEPFRLQGFIQITCPSCHADRGSLKSQTCRQEGGQAGRTVNEKRLTHPDVLGACSPAEP